MTRPPPPRQAVQNLHGWVDFRGLAGSTDFQGNEAADITKKGAGLSDGNDDDDDDDDDGDGDGDDGAVIRWFHTAQRVRGTVSEALCINELKWQTRKVPQLSQKNDGTSMKPKHTIKKTRVLENQSSLILIYPMRLRLVGDKCGM